LCILTRYGHLLHLPAFLLLLLLLLQYGTHYAGYVRNLNAGLSNATAAGVKLSATDLTSE
jgi:hypothetical protein